MSQQKPLNPYIAGSALDDPPGFFGREDILRLVETELRAPQQNAVVLFGQRRIGKTSILLQLRRPTGSTSGRRGREAPVGRGIGRRDRQITDLAQARKAENARLRFGLIHGMILALSKARVLGNIT